MMQTGNLIDVGARTRIPAQRRPGRADLALWDAAKQEAIEFAPPVKVAVLGPPSAVRDAVMKMLQDEAATRPATARQNGQAPTVTAKRPRGSGGQPEGKNK